LEVSTQELEARERMLEGGAQVPEAYIHVLEACLHPLETRKQRLEGRSRHRGQQGVLSVGKRWWVKDLKTGVPIFYQPSCSGGAEAQDKSVTTATQLGIRA
jgi:hypothetical protein